MNIMDKICELYGVDFDEEFTTNKGEPCDIKYCFKHDGLYQYCNKEDGWMRNRFVLQDILTGAVNIVRPHFKPEDGQGYWYYTDTNNDKMDFKLNENDDVDKNNLSVGNCFKTVDECYYHLSDIIANIKEKYKNG